MILPENDYRKNKNKIVYLPDKLVKEFFQTCA